MGLIFTLIGACGAVMILGMTISGPRHMKMPTIKLPQRKSKISAMVWPDVVDDLASAVRAGMSLPHAVCELAHSGPTEVQQVFTRVQETYFATGDFHLALAHIRQLGRSSIAEKFATALDIAYDVGGTDLGKVLRTLSAALRADINMRMEIRARQSWTINGARIAVAAPWLTALLLSARAQAAQAYTSAEGVRLLIGCAALSLLAYVVMMRLSRLPHEAGSSL